MISQEWSQYTKTVANTMTMVTCSHPSWSTFLRYCNMFFSVHKYCSLSTILSSILMKFRLEHGLASLPPIPPCVLWIHHGSTSWWHCSLWICQWHVLLFMHSSLLDPLFGVLRYNPSKNRENDRTLALSGHSSEAE